MKEKTKFEHNAVLQTVISCSGLAVFAAAFIYWLMTNANATPAGTVIAAVMWALYVIICLRFVPAWLSFWSGEERAETESRSSSLKEKTVIFALFLGADIIMLLLVYAARFLANGSVEPFLKELECFKQIDTKYYLTISEGWYWDISNLVFFPGYPLCIRAANCIVGNSFLSALIVSGLLYALCGCFLYELLLIDYPVKTARRALKYLVIVPPAFFFAAPMSESLFLLTSILAIYYFRKGHRLAGCFFGACCAFTRAVGVLVFAPAVFEAVRELISEPSKKKKGLSGLAMCLIIPLGTAAFMAVNYFAAGDPLTFIKIEDSGWGQKLGFFFNSSALQINLILNNIKEGSVQYNPAIASNIIACFAALLLLVFASRRMRASYLVWFMVYYAIAIGPTFLLSGPRYLVSAVPLYIAFAELVGDKKTDAVLSALCLAGSLCYIYMFASGGGVC